MPLINGDLGRDQGGGVAKAVIEDFENVLRILDGNGIPHPIIEDQEAPAGMKADDVKINVTGDTTGAVVSIKGEMKHEEEKKPGEDKSWHIREQRWGAFERSVRLPAGVNSDKAKADFENGILTITMPKAEELKPKTITVKEK